MADYTLSAKITGDSSGFSKAFKSANDTLNTLSEKTKAVSDRISDMGQKFAMGGAAITAGITTPFIGAIKTTADFDSAMRKAGAIAGATAKELDDMTQAALDLGASTSLSSSEVAIAMTDMAAKGFDATQVIAAMPGVIAAAEASGEDLALTANTVASALNGFQMSAEDSSKVADILAMTANKTAAGIEDMSYAFKYAAAPASSLGISIEELSAATGLMVNAGLDGSQAGTSLRMALVRLAKPTEESSKAMQVLGFDVLDAEGNFKPLNEIIGELSKSMEGMTEAQKLANLATIFGTEAATGMLILLNEGQEGLKGLTSELENSSGASAAAAEQMKAGIGGALENLSGAIESATISVMSQLTPLITDIAKWVTELVEKFNGLDDGTKKMIAIAAGILAAAGPVLTIIGLMTMGIGGLISAVGFLISPVGLVAAAIVGLGAVFGQQLATNEKFREGILDIVKAVKDKALKVFETLKGIVEAVIPVFVAFFTSIASGFNDAGGVGSGFLIQMISIFTSLNPVVSMVVALFQNFGPQIVSAVQQIATMLIPVVTTIGTAIGQLASAVIPIVMTAIQTLIPIIIQLAMTLMGIIEIVLPILISLFTQFVPIIMQVVMIFAEIITQVIPLAGILISALLPVIIMIIEAFMNIVQVVAPALIAIIGLILAAVESLIPVFMSIATVVVNVIASVIATISPIVAFIAGIITAIMAVISPIVTFIAGIIASIINVITPIINTVTGIFNNIFTVISGVWQNIMNIIGIAINTIGKIISKLSSTVSSVFNTIWNTISTIMNGISNTISGVFTSIQASWNGLTTFVSGVFDGVSKGVGELVNKIKGLINGVIGGINGAIWTINLIPGVNIGEIPYLARGTDDWQGGFARINEGGRGELVNLPNGAQVIPHDVSMRYAREAAKASTSKIEKLSSGYETSGNTYYVNIDAKNVKEFNDVIKLTQGLKSAHRTL